MHANMFIYRLLIKRLQAIYKVHLCFIVLSVTVYTVRYVCSFHRDQIFMDFVSFKFLSMIIYEVLYRLSWCLRYIIFSAWFFRYKNINLFSFSFSSFSFTYSLAWWGAWYEIFKAFIFDCIGIRSIGLATRVL